MPKNEPVLSYKQRPGGSTVPRSQVVSGAQTGDATTVGGQSLAGVRKAARFPAVSTLSFQLAPNGEAAEYDYFRTTGVPSANLIYTGWFYYDGLHPYFFMHGWSWADSGNIDGFISFSADGDSASVTETQYIETIDTWLPFTLRIDLTSGFTPGRSYYFHVSQGFAALAGPPAADLRSKGFVFYLGH